MGIPRELFHDTAGEAAAHIIGHLAKPGYSFSAIEKVAAIYELLRLNPHVAGFAVIQDGEAMGFMTTDELSVMISDLDGYRLHSHKTIEQIAGSVSLKADYDAPAEYVLRQMTRIPSSETQGYIIVQKDGRYYGTVTVRELIDACNKANINTEPNPLRQAS